MLRRVWTDSRRIEPLILDGTPSSIAVDNDGLLAAGVDHRLHWISGDGRLRASRRLPPVYLHDMLFLPDGSLATALDDDTIRVWDLQTDFRTAKPDAVTLTQQFMRHGYHAVGIGKIFHNNIQDPPSWSEPKLNVPDYPFDPDAVYRAPDNIAWIEQQKQELEQKLEAANIDYRLAIVRFGTNRNPATGDKCRRYDDEQIGESHWCSDKR